MSTITSSTRAEHRCPPIFTAFLLLDKPLGLSSAGAVARVKRLFNARKAGHTGSLDPLASGLLPICFGEATKFGTQLLEADKTYRVTVRLGERTPSADRESGGHRDARAAARYSREQLQRALGRVSARLPADSAHAFRAEAGWQTPVRICARRHHARARRARHHHPRACSCSSGGRPDLSFDVRCTKGAYIRVLAEDLAAQLGTIGHLAALRRLAVAPFRRRAAMVVRGVGGHEPWTQRHEVLLPVDAALSAWRRFDLPAGGVSALRQGQTLLCAR